MSKSIETITPKKAAEWLRQNNRNRPLSDKWANELAGRITRGEWKMNGETIKFNCDGNIVDGQHRLQAIVKAGISVPCYVVRGVQEDAFDTIDQGMKRSNGQMFARDGVKHYNAAAAACTFLYRYENGVIRHKGSVIVTPTMARTVYDSHRGLSDAIQYVAECNVHKLMSYGNAGALCWLMRQKDEKAADNFFLAVGLGENLTRGMPAYNLRSRLQANRAEQRKVSPIVVAAFTIKAWNALRNKRPLGVLKWTDDEEFPEVK